MVWTLIVFDHHSRRCVSRRGFPWAPTQRTEGKLSHLTPNNWSLVPSKFNNTRPGLRTCQFQQIIKQWTNITTKEVIYTACALIVFDRRLRHFHNNLAAVLDGKTPGKLSHLNNEQSLITENWTSLNQGDNVLAWGEYVRRDNVLGVPGGIMSGGIMSYIHINKCCFFPFGFNYFI